MNPIQHPPFLGPLVNRRQPYGLDRYRGPLQRRIPPWNLVWALSRSPSVSANDNHHKLFQYMPRLMQFAYEWNMQPVETIPYLVSDSQIIRENYDYSLISASNLAHAYDTVIRAVQDYANDEAIAANIRTSLELFLAENSEQGIGRWQADRDMALIRFLAMSEVSRNTESSRLGKILCTVFLSNHPVILQQDHRHQLGEWMFAILNSLIPDDDKRVCIQKFLDYRPEVEREFGFRRWPNEDTLTKELEDVTIDLRRNDLLSREQGLQRLPASRAPRLRSSPELHLARPRLAGVGLARDDFQQPWSSRGDREAVEQLGEVRVLARELTHRLDRLEERPF